jgi:hypothetical protein
MQVRPDKSFSYFYSRNLVSGPLLEKSLQPDLQNRTTGK